MEKYINLLAECKIQLEHLNEKLGETDTTNNLLSKLNSLLDNKTTNNTLATDIENFKKKYPELNQDGLDKCIKLLDLNQYEKEIVGNSIFYKKDGNIYIEHYLKTDSFWLDYDLIRSVFESEFTDNYKLFRKISKYILEEIYKCKVVSTDTAFFQ